MKKLYALSLFLFITSALFAQGISRNNLPFAGETYDGIYITNNSSWDPGSAGASQTWDMSSYQGDNVPFVYSAVDQTSVFAGSEMKLNLNGVGTAYFKSTDNSYMVTGMVNSFNGESLTIPYSDPQIIFKFPLSYQDSFRDTAKGSYKGTQTVNYGGMDINVDATTKRTVYSQTTVDGVGTLNLPGRSYSNVIRVKVSAEIRDTITPDPPYQSYEQYAISNSEEYYYFSSDFKHELAYLFKLTSDAFTETIELTFIFPSPVILNTFSALEPENVVVYPNPANDYINVKAEEGTDFTLYNISGESVIHRKVVKGNNKLDVSTLPNGIYHYQLNSNGTVSKGKITLF